MIISYTVNTIFSKEDPSKDLVYLDVATIEETPRTGHWRFRLLLQMPEQDSDSIKRTSMPQFIVHPKWDLYEENLPDKIEAHGAIFGDDLIEYEILQTDNDFKLYYKLDLSNEYLSYDKYFLTLGFVYFKTSGIIKSYRMITEKDPGGIEELYLTNIDFQSYQEREETKSSTNFILSYGLVSVILLMIFNMYKLNKHNI